MAKQLIKLKAEERVGDFGSAGSRRILRQGRIPCIIYGQEKPFAFTVDALEFKRLRGVLTRTTLIELDIENRDIICLLKDVQENLLNDKIIHLDFYEVKRGKALTTNISVVLRGTAKGVREGGVIEQIMHETSIECLPRMLPENIEVDVSNLGVNESISLKDIPTIEGVKFLDDPDSTVCTIKFVKEEKVETAETEAAESAGTASASGATATGSTSGDSAGAGSGEQKK